ncbi:GNAT family N-acetyltransferase [Bacillus shivajii]|uniref:GNAT family N-acetyltransferase n=1 Tax=Bacillus shivajii TaxID=1983719 RepID=UPI001CFB30BC|nr:GNAT family protein [Bacillus shivajii]UCZ54231.1 GNAT family N-acetyltransferase [Bacillus shivajii]
MIELKPFTKKDFPLLLNWINKTSAKFLMKWSGSTFTFPLTEKQLKNYTCRANKDESDTFIFTALLKDTGRPIGHIAIRKIDYQHRSARLGKVLIGDEKDRGKGYTKMMIYDALSFAFDTLNLHRVSLGVFDNNNHAKQIYERFGFKTEGYFRDFRFVDGEYWGMYEMSLLQHEWLEIKNSNMKN